MSASTPRIDNIESNINAIENQLTLLAPTLMTAQLAQLTAVNFTDIPNWVKKISVIFNGVSTTGTSSILVQVGSGAEVSARLTLNGSTVLSYPQSITTGNTSPIWAFSGARLVYLNVGDYIEVYGTNNGGPLNITGQSNYLTVCEVP